MNLIEQIMDQFSGDALGKLGALLGTDEKTVGRATSAAVPSLLAAMAGLSSHDDGAKKLMNVLGGLNMDGQGNLAQMLGGDTGSLLNKGTSMLGSLCGDSMISGIANSISRFTELNAGIVKSLLAYLAPMVLGKVASQWKSQSGTSQALKSLFADQRSNITNALPAGLSLADIPGLNVGKSAYSSTRKTETEPVTAGSPARWLLPLAAVLLGGFFLWQFLSRPQVEQAVAEKAAAAVDKVEAMKPTLPNGIDLPNLTGVRDELGSLFKSLDTEFTDIKDAASAERAMPALRELNTKIDSMNQVLSQLPEAGRVTLRPVLEEQIKLASEKANAASSVEGIGAEVKALIQEIVSKITKWITADAK